MFLEGVVDTQVEYLMLGTRSLKAEPPRFHPMHLWTIGTMLECVLILWKANTNSWYRGLSSGVILNTWDLRGSGPWSPWASPHSQVPDEATASVDHTADAAIQAGLRAHVAASGTTVITITHRLSSIADYDRIVVLDYGRIVEQRAASELLGRTGEGAVFRRLCEESGDLEEIRRVAIM